MKAIRLSTKIVCRQLVLFSLVLWLTITIAFEGVAELSRLSSASLMICLGCYILYLLGIKRIRTPIIIIQLLGLSILFIISCMYSPTSKVITHMYLSRFLKTVIILLIAANVINNEKQFKIILNAIILGGVCLALYMYFKYGIANLVSMGGRLDNRLGNQNTVGMKCAYSICFSFISIKMGKYKWPYILSIIICFPAVMFTGSRKSLMVIIVIITSYYLITSRDGKLVRNVFLIIISLAIIYYVISRVDAFSTIFERMQQLSSLLNVNSNSVEIDGGDANRIMFIKSGLRQFLEHPIFGHGFCASYHTWGTYTHNNYVELLFNQGLIGFILYYSIHIRIGYEAVKYTKGQNFGMFALIFSFLMGRLFLDVGVVSYDSRIDLILFVLMSKINLFYRVKMGEN